MTPERYIPSLLVFQPNAFQDNGRDFPPLLFLSVFLQVAEVRLCYRNLPGLKKLTVVSAHLWYVLLQQFLDYQEQDIWEFPCTVPEPMLYRF